MKIALFAEDDGHRALLVPLIERLAKEERRLVEVEPRNAEGGVGKAIRSLRGYARDLRLRATPFVDVIVAGIDANTFGDAHRRKAIAKAMGDDYAGQVVAAIPRPYIERWYLADVKAIPQVLGLSYSVVLPSKLRKRVDWKTALRDAFRQGGVMPPAGGIEYGPAIAEVMDLEVCRQVPDFDRFLRDLIPVLRSMPTE